MFNLIFRLPGVDRRDMLLCLRLGAFHIIKVFKEWRFRTLKTLKNSCKNAGFGSLEDDRKIRVTERFYLQ